MKKLAIAAAALMLAGCSHVGGIAHAPQVNRTAKADKYAAPKAAPMPTPNQVVKKRWMPKFKIRWLHEK
jgi:hypothetical protein